MSDFQPTLDQSLGSKTNTLPLAAYLDPQTWSQLFLLKRPNTKSYFSKCPNTKLAVDGLLDHVGLAYRWGIEWQPKRWTTTDAGTPASAPRWYGRERIGVRDEICVPLFARNLIRAYAGPYGALGVSDRYHTAHEAWVTDLGMSPPWHEPVVSSVRFDIDLANGWQPHDALMASRQAQQVAQSLGLQWHVFSTGNRGLQLALAFPSKLTIRGATALAALVREPLQRAIGDLGIVDADSTGSILRLPGCRHAATNNLALFIDVEHRQYFDASSQAELIANGFGWIPGHAKGLMLEREFHDCVFEIEACLDSAGITHDVRIRERALAEKLIGMLNSSSSSFVSEARQVLATSTTSVFTAGATTQSTSDAPEGDRRELARHRLLTPPSAGRTWDWMSQPYGGVWACKLIHGDDGLDVLLNLLREVRTTSKQKVLERERTARRLWESFKLFPPKSIKEIHPEDAELAARMVDIVCKSRRMYKHKSGNRSAQVDKRRLTNVIFVSHVLLYCLRKSKTGEFSISTRNGVAIVNRLFGATMSPNTFEATCRLLESEQRVRATFRPGPYRVVESVELVGEPPLVRAFERVPGCTTNTYRESEWLTKQREKTKTSR